MVIQKVNQLHDTVNLKSNWRNFPQLQILISTKGYSRVAQRNLRVYEGLWQHKGLETQQQQTQEI